MDACMSYFDQVDALLESYDERPLYDAVFNEASDDVDVANAETEEKAISLLQKAINAMKALIQKIKDILNTVISWVKADNAEISEYKKFCQQIKQNPELKNKKVTLRDYRQVIAEYDKQLGDAEKKYRAMKDEEAANKPNFADDVKAGIAATGKKVASIATSVGASFTVESALEYARQNTKNAAIVQTVIDNDFLILKALEKSLGAKEIRKFKWKVKALNCRCRVVRTILGGRMEQSKTLKDTVADTFSSIRSLIGGSKRALGNKDTKDFVKGSGKEVASVIGGVGKEIVKTKYKTHKYAKDAARRLDEDSEILTGRRVTDANREYVHQQADSMRKANMDRYAEIKRAEEEKRRAIEEEKRRKREQKAAKKQAKADKKRAKRGSANMESGELSLDMIDDLSAFTE